VSVAIRQAQLFFTRQLLYVVELAARSQAGECSMLYGNVTTNLNSLHKMLTKYTYVFAAKG
jgi:hypothetical protein